MIPLLFYFWFVSTANIANGGESKGHTTYAECMEWAHLYNAEGEITSMCYGR